MILKRTIILTCLISSNMAFAASCMSPSALHSQKMAKYSMPEFPSLLEDCGLNDLLSKFGGELFKSFKIDMPDFSVCGYNTKDMASWFGVDYNGTIGVDAKFNFGSDLTAESLINGGGKLFDAGYEFSSDQFDQSNNGNVSLKMD